MMRLRGRFWGGLGKLLRVKSFYKSVINILFVPFGILNLIFFGNCKTL